VKKKLLAFVLIILAMNFSSPLIYVKGSSGLLPRVYVYEEFDKKYCELIE